MSPTYISVLVAIFQLWVKASSIDPGTVIQVDGKTIDIGPIVIELKKFMSETNGRRLRIKTNGGCMDAGHESEDKKIGGLILTPYINQDCGIYPWTKWFWDGDYLKVGWKKDYLDTYGCLGFWDETENPDLDVFNCVDISLFIIRFHPHQFDFSRSEIYFSIHSKVHPTKCLGMYTKDLELHPSYRGAQNKTVRRDVFQLQECHGFDHQSFYLVHRKLDILDIMKRKIFGQTTPADPGTAIKVGNSIVNTEPMIRKFKEFMGQNDGRQLRIKVKSGCVDAGFQTIDPKAGNILTPYMNEQCDLHPWTKWFWDGDYLKVGWTSDYPGTYGCLGFWNETDFPDVDVFNCVDISPFIIRFHPNQFDFTRLEIYFSIHSKVHPTKCLGMHTKSFKLQPSHEESGNKTFQRDVFQLQECYGLDHQSFYLDSEQFDVIDNIKQKIFGPNGIFPSDRDKNCNDTSTHVNQIEVVQQSSNFAI